MEVIMKSKKLLSKLNSLFWGELFSSIMFPTLYLWFNFSKSKFNFVTFVIVIGLSIILLEGAFYWKHLTNKILGNKVMERGKIGRLYNVYKTFNFFSLILFAIMILFFCNSTGIYELFFQVFLYVFLILEYINYFHIRLSFYTKNKLFLQIIKPIKIMFNKSGKTSKIANDINYFKDNKGD